MFVTIPAAAIVLLLGLLTGAEGRAYTAYYDVAGILTVCDGITGPGVVKGKTYTDAECDALGRAYVERMSRTIGKCLGGRGLTFGQWVWWGHFSYNTGEDTFCRSTAAKLLRQGRDREACAQMPRWRFITKNGVKKDCAVRSNNCYGIVKRRQLEYDGCMAHSP